MKKHLFCENEVYEAQIQEDQRARLWISDTAEKEQYSKTP